MEIKKETIDYALSVLNTQRSHCNAGRGGKEQRAYYDGMRNMLELICTGGYKNLSFSVALNGNCHYIPKIFLFGG